MMSEVKKLTENNPPNNDFNGRKIILCNKETEILFEINLTQQRLNNVMLRHIHKYATDNLGMVDIAS